MTNLEFYKDEIYKTQKDLFENKDIRVPYGIGIAICDVYEKYKGVHAFMPMVLDWLLAEHKGPVKLKQWEYDLIRANEMSHDLRFKSFRTYRNMKAMGYFEGITDTSMTLKEILDNCEVVE